jgi:molecular chaperone DnaK (HSP70)
MLCCVGDPYVGGRTFDLAVAEHLRTEFCRGGKPDFRNNGRSWLRLLQEVEKLKHHLSGDDSTDQLIYVAKVVDDTDLTAKMNR